MHIPSKQPSKQAKKQASNQASKQAILFVNPGLHSASYHADMGLGAEACALRISSEYLLTNIGSTDS